MCCLGNLYDEMSISDIQYKVLTQESCRHRVDIANNEKVAMDSFDRNEFLETIKNLKQKDVNLDHLSKPCHNKEYLKSINALLESDIVKG